MLHDDLLEALLFAVVVEDLGMGQGQFSTDMLKKCEG